MNGPVRSRDLVVAADPHVGRDDPDLPGFLAWLAARREDAGTVVLLGDLFSLWLGLPRWTEPHHRAVLDACAGLRAAGVRVVLVEGNRELWAEPWAGRAFDVVAREWRCETPDGTRWIFLHGDLLNRDDRRNLVFQAVVRSRWTRAFFRALPAAAALGVGRRLERALRARYRRPRTAPAPAHLAAWARDLRRRGTAAALGHFHVELHRPAGGPGETDLWLVPDWRAARRYLRIPAAGVPRFEEGGPPPGPRPRIAGAEPAPGGSLLLRLAGPVPLPRPGAFVAVDGGEGPEVRRGRILEVRGDADGDTVLVVRLEGGPPVRPGDRLILPGREAPDVP